MSGPGFFMVLISLLAAIAVLVLGILVIVLLFRGLRWLFTTIFFAIGWLISHIAEFIMGTIGDALRFIGALLAMVVLAPLAVGNVVIGRWSAAGHFAESVSREFIVATGCLYRIALRRPLKLLWLHGLLEGLEQRVPEAMHAAPTSDRPRRGPAGQFDGYTIVGSLPGGGSGGKLYIARPDDTKRRRLTGGPEHVVIKSFVLTEGSSLPQIVRESRALEAAKKLGHVLDHGMDDDRFFYVMPYHPGDHLGIITRQLHAEAGGDGLTGRQLSLVMAYCQDLLATLALYHQHGLWHKDVKPENIIVHHGRAHLVDLGLVTPLKSAMTLTTHGTEYFRDPEMVRMALRGVKVHQVNGAKFDIYAAGAVLYFMLENTFPAHGGLSQFARRAPEALRWIVRRAMAEYGQRYESAELMLADLERVSEAADPFALKPADLPSMREGAASPDLQTHTEPPPAASRRPWSEPAAAGRLEASFVPPAVAYGGSARPRLRVTNWWTGEYVVDDEGDGHRGPGRRRRAARGSESPRSRRTVRPARAGADRQPSPALIVLGLIFIGLMAMLLFSIFSFSAIHSPIEPDARGSRTAAAQDRDRAELERIAALKRTTRNLPVLLVLDDDYATSARNPRVSEIIQNYAERGFHVLAGVGPDPAAMRDLVDRWSRNEAGTLLEIEKILAEHNLFGLLRIPNTQEELGQPQETLITSRRPGALQRRWPSLDGQRTITPVAEVPDRPWLLINDHPAKGDPRVDEAVERMLAPYRSMGWELVSDIEADAAARVHLPAGKREMTDAAQEALREVVAKHELGGVLLIYAADGEDAAHGRVALRTFEP